MRVNMTVLVGSETLSQRTGDWIMAKTKNKSGKGKAAAGNDPAAEAAAVVDTPTTTTDPTPKFNAPEVSGISDETTGTYKKLDIRQIKSNVGQSRGAGVLYNMKQLGWRAFPNDPTPGKADNGRVVLDDLLSGDTAKISEVVKLLDEHEPDIRSMAVALASKGQLQPIVIRPIFGDDGDPVEGEWNVSAGARRTLAKALLYAESGGTVSPTLDANVMGKMEAADELEMALSENHDRKNQSPIDDALLFQKLKREYGLSPKQIAKRIYGKEESYQTVTQRMQLLRGSPEQIARCHEGKLGATNLLKAIKDKDGGGKGEASDKPGVGERGKVPSVAQCKELLAAVKPSDLKEDTAERFGKGTVWQLIKTSNDVRKIMALWAKVPFQTYDELVAAKQKEREDNIKAAAAAAAEKQKTDGEE